MAAGQERPYVDPQHLTDTETGLYELLATFEYQGRPMTVDAVAAAAGLDSGTAAGMLERLADRDVLVRSGAGDQPGYELARRDWSAAPGLRRHFPAGHGAAEQEPSGQMTAGAEESPASRGTAPGRARRQEAQADQLRSSHLREERDRGEYAREQLEAGERPARPANAERPSHAERAPDAEDAAPADDRDSSDENAGEQTAASPTAPDHLMPGPAPQGRVPNAPDTLIAAADSEGERPTRARFVANTAPGQPDGEVDTRS